MSASEGRQSIDRAWVSKTPAAVCAPRSGARGSCGGTDTCAQPSARLVTGSSPPWRHPARACTDGLPRLCHGAVRPVTKRPADDLSVPDPHAASRCGVLHRDRACDPELADQFRRAEPASADRRADLGRSQSPAGACLWPDPPGAARDGGLDLAPLVVFIGIYALRIILTNNMALFL